jgi:hypothetical protein
MAKISRRRVMPPVDCGRRALTMGQLEGVRAPGSLSLRRRAGPGCPGPSSITRTVRRLTGVLTVATRRLFFLPLRSGRVTVPLGSVMTVQPRRGWISFAAKRSWQHYSVVDLAVRNDQRTVAAQCGSVEVGSTHRRPSSRHDRCSGSLSCTQAPRWGKRSFHLPPGNPPPISRFPKCLTDKAPQRRAAGRWPRSSRSSVSTRPVRQTWSSSDPRGRGGGSRFPGCSPTLPGRLRHSALVAGG